MSRIVQREMYLWMKHAGFPALVEFVQQNQMKMPFEVISDYSFILRSIFDMPHTWTPQRKHVLELSSKEDSFLQLSELPRQNKYIPKKQNFNCNICGTKFS